MALHGRILSLLSVFAAATFVTTTLGFAPIAYGQQVLLEHLTFEYADGHESAGSEKQTASDKAVKKACIALGRALSVGKGPWQFGVFRTFSCLRGGRSIYGSPRNGAWRLTITSTPSALKLLLTRVFSGAEGATPVEVLALSLPPSSRAAELMAHPRLVPLIAYALLDSMPMGMLVTKTDVRASRDGGRITRRRLAANDLPLPDPPERLALYRLTWSLEERLWRPDLQGQARRIAINGSRAIFQVDGAVRAALDEGPLWAQDIAGLGQRRKRLNEAILNEMVTIQAAGARPSRPTAPLDAFIETAASGYVGARYGLHILPGDRLLERSRFFGLLVELRGGPLKGLRYYYDRVPRAELTEADTLGVERRLHIEWSRHCLAYSFGIDLEGWISRLTATPRLGLWDVDMVAATSRDSSGAIEDAQPFRVKKALSIGLEIGAEFVSESYTIRPWYGIDHGASAVKVEASVTSNRSGLDAYLTAGPTMSLFGNPVKAAFLVFAFIESLNIADPKAKDELADGEVSVRSIDYVSGFLGGGLAVSW